MDWKKKLYLPTRIKRKKKETKSIKEILKQLNDEDEDTKFEEEIEEVMRLGPYIEDKPSRLDLLFTKEINLEKDINYECPMEEVTMWSWKLRLREI